MCGYEELLGSSRPVRRRICDTTRFSWKMGNAVVSDTRESISKFSMLREFESFRIGFGVLDSREIFRILEISRKDRILVRNDSNESSEHVEVIITRCVSRQRHLFTFQLTNPRHYIPVSISFSKRKGRFIMHYLHCLIIVVNQGSIFRSFRHSNPFLFSSSFFHGLKLIPPFETRYRNSQGSLTFQSFETRFEHSR